MWGGTSTLHCTYAQQWHCTSLEQSCTIILQDTLCSSHFWSPSYLFLRSMPSWVSLVLLARELDCRRRWWRKPTSWSSLMVCKEALWVRDGLMCRDLDWLIFNLIYSPLSLHLSGQIISRFESKGYKLNALKLETPPKELLEEHYKDLKDKPFFPKLMGYMTSGAQSFHCHAFH